MRAPREPFAWALFSAGGMIAALLLPALVLVLWLAGPLGWPGAADPERLAAIARHPLARLVVFGVIALSLAHAAHRFRYTLYDGLQLYHLNALIAVLTYGLAAALTAVAAAVLAFAF